MKTFFTKYHEDLYKSEYNKKSQFKQRRQSYFVSYCVVFGAVCEVDICATLLVNLRRSVLCEAVLTVGTMVLLGQKLT